MSNIDNIGSPAQPLPGDGTAKVVSGEDASGRAVTLGDSHLTSEQKEKVTNSITTSTTGSPKPMEQKITAPPAGSSKVEKLIEKFNASVAERKGQPQALSGKVQMELAGQEGRSVSSRTADSTGKSPTAFDRYSSAELVFTEVGAGKYELVGAEALRVKVQTNGSDLRTAQGARANIHAAKTLGCVMSTMAHMDGVALQKIVPPGSMTPRVQFETLMGCLKEVAEKADLKNPNDINLLNGLSGLMKKGFDGGVGTFQKAGDATKFLPFNLDTHASISWKDAGITTENLQKMFPGRNEAEYTAMLDSKLTDSDYNTVSKDSDPGLKQKVDDKVAQNNAAGNAKALEKFKGAVNYFSENAAHHFTPSEGRHQAGVELASVQLAATFGQLVHDFILAPRTDPKEMTSGESLLKPLMIEHGLIKETKEFDTLSGLENNMRSNPLLAEVENRALASEVKAVFINGAKREEMVGILEKKLNELNTGAEKLSEKEIKDLANKLVDQFAKQIGDMKFNTKSTGARGRTALDRKPPAHMGAATAAVMGFQPKSGGGANELCAVMPNRKDDGIAAEWAAGRLGLTDPDVNNLREAISDQHILFHGGSPPGILRMGTGLDSGLKNLAMNPAAFLKGGKGGISEALAADAEAQVKMDPREANILKALMGELDKPTTRAEMQKVMMGEKNKDTGKYEGGIDVTFNAPTKQKMQLGDFANMQSVASIMYQNDLRTICSISGTTVDIVEGLSLAVGTEGMKALLAPMMQYMENPKDFAPLNTPEGQKFKEVFASISFFMQSGQYHTAGEVLGGLFIAARGFSAGEEANKDIDKTFQMFSGVMEAFSKNPENFFPLNDQDKAALTDQAGIQALARKIAH